MNTTMGVKENIDRKPQVKLGLAIGLLVVAIGFALWYIHSNRPAAPPTQSYYSADDGTSWFADVPGKITPFDHDGKMAVACVVVDMPNGRVAAFLQKYSDSYRALAMKSANSQGVQTSTSQGLLMRSGILIKRPKDPQWFSIDSAEGEKIQASAMQGTPVEP